MNFTFKPHAIEQMQEREIPLQVVLEVLNHPEEITLAKNCRHTYQSIVQINGKPYIVRAIVDPDGIVVTVYRSSKVSKYQGENDEEDSD